MARYIDYDTPDLPLLAFRKLGGKLVTLEGKGGGSAPAPDPLIGQSALANAKVAQEALDWYKQTYANDLKPRQAATDALTSRVVNDQLDTSAINKQRGTEQWDRFVSVFQPVEDQTVADATNIDSAGELARASGEAAAGVQTQFDNAAGQRARSQAAMGINPNSGRAMAMDSEAQLGLAASKAGASNNARLVARDRGIALRAGVANFGRNMPNTAANAYGLAMNANQGATGANAGANAGALNNANFAGQGFNTAIHGNNSAGSMMANQYGQQVSAYNAQQAADGASSAGIGNMIGTVGAAAMPYLMAMSSKKIKENKKPVDDGETLDKVKDLPVDAWKYKDGVADGGEHIGAYAEDVNKKFGDKAAPGGKAIDMISMHGITLSAVKGLAKQVGKLENKVEKIAARGIGRA